MLAPAALAQEDAREGDPETTASDLDDRISFDVTLDSERGGGRLTGSAGDFEYEDGSYLLATGGVRLQYRDVKLSADRVRVDVPTNRIEAQGEVILDEGPRRLAGEVLEYDLDTRTGRITRASAYVDPDFYFFGETIAKTGPITYTVEDGTFTACESENPAWSIDLKRASITLEEYARIRGATLKFGRVPALYVPYLLWPATTERSSGWLVPKPGYSSREGAQLSLAYYRTFGRSADATIYADLSSEEYNGIGAEYRYRPSADTEGVIEAYYLFEPEDGFEDNEIFDPDRERGDDRWKLALYHDSRNLFGGDWRGVVNLNFYSDFDYLKDVERRVNRQTQPFFYSNAYLSTSQGPHSLTFMVDQRERIVRSTQARDTRRQLPEIDYRLRPVQILDLPVYFQMRSSVNYFDLEVEPPVGDDGVRPESSSDSYGRADLAPTLSISLPGTSWLNAKIDLGGRVTHYTDSLDEARTGFSGDSLTRAFPSAAFEVVGPSISRIYDTGGERWSKFKHIVEPRLNYRYVDEFDDQDQVLRFDEVDLLRPVNVAVVSVVNRLLAKPAGEDASAFEIASFEVAQGYNLDDQPGQSSFDGTMETSEGPIFSTLRVNPDRDTSLKLDAQYNTLFNRLTAVGLSGGTDIGRHNVGLTWFTRWNAETGDETQDTVRLFTRFELWRDRLSFDAEVDYNLID
ncbi:MAG: LPS assembly protein LptD, partial [Acidobacteriota bacterium]